MTAIGRRAFLAATAGLVVAACRSTRREGSATTAAGSTTAPSATPPTAVPSTAPPSTAATTTTTAPPLAASPFTLGIASGEPTADAVVLWTRLLLPGTVLAPVVSVQWQVATDDGFTDLVAHGTVDAVAADGHSVHVDAGGLRPATWYHYRFSAGGHTSPAGRTRTMPADDDGTTPLVMASASCQSYADGYYAAHRDIASSGVDLVLWLGDYIYEGAGPASPPGPRAHPPLEPTTLEEYRDRYALYKSDPALQAAHAAAPWLVLWDDHEVENNIAGDHSEDPAVPAQQVRARRAAAYQAWWEHQPVRLPRPTSADYPVYRTVHAGGLATILVLDERQYRTDQACGDRALSLDPACPEVDEPGRTMLGVAQEQWLDEQLSASTSPWNVLANEVVLADTTVGKAVLNYDQWDGYPEARRRLVASLAQRGRGSTVVVTGDIHLAGVTDVTAPDGTLVATELVTTSISSSGNVPASFEGALRGLPHVRWAELSHRGWTRHDVTPTSWTATYRIVDDVSKPDSPSSTAATFVIDAGRPGARQI